MIRTITVKVFDRGNKKHITRTTRAGARRHFSEANIEAILAEYVEKLEAVAPDQYRMVQVGPGAFNFIHLEHKDGCRCDECRAKMHAAHCNEIRATAAEMLAAGTAALAARGA